ncbi:inheritance of peroxisomes protein 1-domain-containing protein [Apiosordaria backusii]|uniref:Inheritance of peroxisomes protein 1 n=1 Tax=Apiosordaria backusii TaxID=314023 RepID=A0AA40AEI4_9PEZI|nr:inheritance of peroxisomes protein 1-domain-containing protein [Apiosordaria backusii]
MDSSRIRGASFTAPRRVFTAPAQQPAIAPPRPSSSSSAQPTSGLVDTLYDHPNVKIVSFSAGSQFLAIGSKGMGPDIEPGSLSWSSQLERTIAVGPFRIYRAPGSVAFLSCGSALQPILKKSQVWCVDEESSKFVLQIRRPQYWRIEVPVEDPEDQRRAEVLREVFDQILQFEKTPCPFARSFTVELPEHTPVKLKPWTPARRSSACFPVRPVTPVEIAHIHRGPPRGSICLGELSLSEQGKYLESPLEEDPREQETQRQAHDGSPVGEPSGNALRPSPIEIKKTEEKGPVTPPQLTVVTPPSSHTKKPNRPRAESPKRADFQSPADSLDSFHSPDSWPSTTLPLSPPISSPGSPRSSLPLRTSLRNLNLDTPVTPVAAPNNKLTATAKTSQTWSATTSESAETEHSEETTLSSSISELECSPKSKAPTQKQQSIPSIIHSVPEEAIEDESESEPFPTDHTTPTPTIFVSPSPSSTTISTAPNQQQRRPAIRRATTSSSLSPNRRALSPLPPAADLFTPRSTLTSSPPSNRQLRSLPLTVIQKTCEILMSPPSHLIALMLKIAARIMAGEWKGLIFGWGEKGEKLEVEWDYSDDDDHVHPQQRKRNSGQGRARGWSTLTVNNNNENERVDDWWLKRKKSRDRMAGTFPESDDEEVDPLENVGGKYHRVKTLSGGSEDDEGGATSSGVD